MDLLLTDLIDSQGGSCELIRVLNRFGAIASSDTQISTGDMFNLKCSKKFLLVI